MIDYPNWWTANQMVRIEEEVPKGGGEITWGKDWERYDLKEIEAKYRKQWKKRMRETFDRGKPQWANSWSLKNTMWCANL